MSLRASIARRDFVCAAAALAAGTASWAQPAPRRYATMSLIGDQLTAVQRANQVGSHMSRNDTTEIAVKGDVVDRAALGVVNEAIRKADGAAKPVSLLVDEPILYQQQARLFDGNFVRMPLSLLEAARQGGATHLLLLTKLRAPLKFQFDRGGRAGEGTASGLGFYVEPDLMVRDDDNKRETEGFLGLFVHLRATIVDLASESIVADRNVVATNRYVNTREGFGGLPWNALSPGQKVAAVSELLLVALRDHIPQLLKV